jgi:hypothetical protein
MSIEIHQKVWGGKPWGGLGKFRVMTLEEAKALPSDGGAYIWVRMTNNGAQQFKTYGTGISNLNRVRLATESFGITERDILNGQVLVEIEEETK